MATKSQILKKEQILSNWVEARQKILRDVTRLTTTQQEIIFLGIWSIKDLLAHLAGWDFTNYAAVKSVLRGQVPAFYQYRDRDWQTYNARLVKKYKKDSLQELLMDLEASQQKLLEQLQKFPPEDFQKDFGVRFHGYKVTVGRLLEAETKDEQIHFEQVAGFFRGSK